MIQMRYIILPFFFLLYVLWTKQAFKSINKASEEKDVNGWAGSWMVIHGLSLLAALILGMVKLIEFSVKNW